MRNIPDSFSVPHLCRIEGQPLAEANEWLEQYRQIWEANFQRLDDLLDELKTEEK